MIALRMSAPRVVPRKLWTGSEAVLAFASLWPVVKPPPVPAYRKTPFGAKPQTAFFMGVLWGRKGAVGLSVVRAPKGQPERNLDRRDVNLSCLASKGNRAAGYSSTSRSHKASMNSRAGLHPIAVRLNRRLGRKDRPEIHPSASRAACEPRDSRKLYVHGWDQAYNDESEEANQGLPPLGKLLSKGKL